MATSTLDKLYLEEALRLEQRAKWEDNVRLLRLIRDKLTTCKERDAMFDALVLANLELNKYQ